MMGRCYGQLFSLNDSLSGMYRCRSSRRARLGCCSALAALLLGACSASTETAALGTTRTTQADSASTEPTSPRPGRDHGGTQHSSTVDTPSLKEGARALRLYLDDWVREGAVAAGGHLVPEQRASQDLPVLTSGRVGHVERQSWSSPRQFTLLVRMDLHFGSDPLAWNEGHNTRFVTFTRSDSASPYLLSFATSP